MEETESNVDEGRRHTTPFLRTCDKEYVILCIEKSGQILWSICSYALGENAEEKHNE